MNDNIKDFNRFMYNKTIHGEKKHFDINGIQSFSKQ